MTRNKIVVRIILEQSLVHNALQYSILHTRSPLHVYVSPTYHFLGHHLNMNHFLTCRQLFAAYVNVKINSKDTKGKCLKF